MQFFEYIEIHKDLQIYLKTATISNILWQFAGGSADWAHQEIVHRWRIRHFQGKHCTNQF